MVQAKHAARRKQQLYFLIFLLFPLFWGACSASQLAPPTIAKTESSLAIDSLISPDAAIAAQILPYKNKLTSTLDSIIGYSARELQEGEVESPLGNFVADLQLEAAQQVTGTPVDLSVVTIGGLRIPLPEGPIRLGVIYELMPFENSIVVLRLNGEQTRQLFEFAARKKIAAIANSKMVVREGKPVSISIGGKAFDPAKSYTVATSDYLANGGDHMFFFREAERLAVTDLLLRNAIAHKIAALHKEGAMADARLEGRIVEIE